jgi:hypothetical protein
VTGIVFGAFFAAFLCLSASSLCNLIRMDRFAGAISSPPEDAFDFDRVWRAGLSSSPSRVGGRSLSESDVIAVEVDAIDRERLDTFLVSAVVVIEPLLLRFSFSMLLGDLDDREV